MKQQQKWSASDHLGRSIKSASIVMATILGGSIATTQLKAEAQQNDELFFADTAYPSEMTNDLRELPIAKEWIPGEPIKSGPPRLLSDPINLLSPVNPVMQKDFFADFSKNNALSSKVSQKALSSTINNFDGIVFSGVNPADPTGEVGIKYYIQSINTQNGSQFTVYDKTNGNKVAGPTNMSSLGSIAGCSSNTLGDPIILFDEIAKRWLLTEFTDQTNKSLCVYVSKTEDPISGGWYSYKFQAPEFPDYPHYGMWGNAYYIGANESGGAAYVLDRSKLLAGQATTMIRKTIPKLDGFQFQITMPVDVEGTTGPAANSPGVFVRHRDDELHNSGSNNSSKDYLELWTFAPDFTNPNNSQLSGPVNIEISEIDSNFNCNSNNFGCLTQKGSSTTLDPLKEAVMNKPVYRNFGSHESILVNLPTKVGNNLSAIRWIELRRNSGGNWALHQEGTYTKNDGNSRYMGSSTMDKDGNIALAYMTTGSNLYPSLRFTGRHAADANGTMTQAEQSLFEGTGSIPSDRNGDYHHMSIDPVDQCTFWFTGQYGMSGGKWGTRISSFKFDNCGGGGGTTPGFTLSATNLSQQVCKVSDLKAITATVTGNNGFNKAVTFSHVNLPSGLTGSFSTNPVSSGGTTNSTVSGTLANGNYSYTVRGKGEGIATPQDLSASINLTASTSAVTLSAPANDATNVDLQPTVSWQADSNAVSYRVEIATDSNFSNIVSSGTVSSGTNYRPNDKLSPNTKHYWRVRSDNSCGNTWSNVFAFTTANATNSNELVNGVAKTSLSAAQNETLEFFITVPAGQSLMNVEMNGGSGDADLYVRYASKPTDSEYDCRPYIGGNNETCNINPVQSGTYYVSIKGYEAFSGVSLKATYSKVTDPNELSNGVAKTGLSASTNETLEFNIKVPAGQSSLKVEINGGSGDADLYVRKNSKPTDNNYDCRPYEAGNTETCDVSSVSQATYYISVKAYETFSGVTLKATYSD